MQGYNLVIALYHLASVNANARAKANAMTFGEALENAFQTLQKRDRQVAVTDRYGITSLRSPAECITLVNNAEDGRYVGNGSPHRVRSIAYQEPEPTPEDKVLDSGFDGFNRYPLPDQSTVLRRAA